MDLSSRLRRKRPILRSLGVHDVFSAMAAEKAGVELLFVGGFGVAASRFGVPDLNLVTATEMAESVRRICARVSAPVIADADTGYGGATNVARTVRLFEQAGAAGLILEDQVSPKRCGHFAGKDVVPVEEMLTRLRAAVAARSHRRFVIVARTDARDVFGFDEAIRRIKIYERAGADVLFVESPGSLKELAAIPRAVKPPVLANMLSGGRTPILPAKRLERLGFAIVVNPVESLMTLGSAIGKLAAAARKGGPVDRTLGGLTFGDVKSLLRLPELLAGAES